jgi:hypothetical protein
MDEQKTTITIPVELRRALKCLAARHDEPMYAALDRCLAVYRHVEGFLACCDAVFGQDWAVTRACLGDDTFVDAAGTLLNPLGADSLANWANREEWLLAYHALRTLIPLETAVHV